MTTLKKPATWRSKKSRVRQAVCNDLADEWRIQRANGRFFFTRHMHGKAVEAYRHVDAGVAAIWAAAIIQGFEPPRGLVHLDRPAIQTQP